MKRRRHLPPGVDLHPDQARIYATSQHTLRIDRFDLLEVIPDGIQVLRGDILEIEAKPERPDPRRIGRGEIKAASHIRPGHATVPGSRDRQAT